MAERYQMDKPKISIIIPVYNGEKHLHTSLDSVEAQSLDDIEIICVNDASTDGTAAILQEYAEKDSRFRIIDNEKNRGEMLSRKAGVEVSRGEYCQFLDSDDELTTVCCETLYSLMQERNADIIQFTHRVLEHRSDGSIIDLPPCASEPIDYTEQVLQHLFINTIYGPTTVNKLYRTAVVQDAYAALDDFHDNVGMDKYATFYIAYYARSLRIINTEPLYIYHYGHGASNRNTMSLDAFRLRCRMCELSQSIKGFLERENAWEKDRCYWQALTENYKSDCCRDYLPRTPDGDEDTAMDMLLSYWDGMLTERDLSRHLLYRLKEECTWSEELEKAKTWYLGQIKFKDDYLSKLENEREHFLKEISQRDQEISQRDQEILQQKQYNEAIRRENDELRQALKIEIERPWYRKLLHDIKKILVKG